MYRVDTYFLSKMISEVGVIRIPCLTSIKFTVALSNPHADHLYGYLLPLGKLLLHGIFIRNVHANCQSGLLLWHLIRYSFFINFIECNLGNIFPARLYGFMHVFLDQSGDRTLLATHLAPADIWRLLCKQHYDSSLPSVFQIHLLVLLRIRKSSHRPVERY